MTLIKVNNTQDNLSVQYSLFSQVLVWRGCSHSYEKQKSKKSGNTVILNMLLNNSPATPSCGPLFFTSMFLWPQSKAPLFGYSVCSLYYTYAFRLDTKCPVRQDWYPGQTSLIMLMRHLSKAWLGTRSCLTTESNIQQPEPQLICLLHTKSVKKPFRPAISSGWKCGRRGITRISQSTGIIIVTSCVNMAVLQPLQAAWNSSQRAPLRFVIVNTIYDRCELKLITGGSSKGYKVSCWYARPSSSAREFFEIKLGGGGKGVKTSYFLLSSATQTCG